MKLETGNINFCGKRALNIKSDDYKNYLLETIQSRHGVLYNKRNYQSYKPTAHKSLVGKYGSTGLLSVVSSGNPYLLYITKDEYSGKNQVFFIDCKVCDGYEYPRIIMLWLRFKEKVYKNTLIRGELVRDRYNNWIFLIDDLMAYCGRNMNKISKEEKVGYTQEMLGELYKRDDKLEIMTLRIKHYFTGDDYERIQNGFIPTLNYDSRGIMIHLRNGMNLYLNTSGKRGRRKERTVKRERVTRETEKRKHKKVNLSASKTDYKTERHIATNIELTIESIDSPVTSPKRTVVLIIKPTDQPDVYKLYAKKNGVNRRVSYAHVPSIEISKMLRNTFDDGNDEALVECNYNKTFDKWTPIRITVGTVDTVSTVKSIKRSV